MAYKGSERRIGLVRMVFLGDLMITFGALIRGEAVKESSKNHRSTLLRDTQEILRASNTQHSTSTRRKKY